MTDAEAIALGRRALAAGFRNWVAALEARP